MADRDDEHSKAHADRSAWLRAAVLGANDGILSTAGLLVGVAASNAAPAQILLTGAAGLTAGALSMAAGEYVSVSSQADVERAELKRAGRDHAHVRARPLQAAAASATSYAAGAALPILTALLSAGPRAAIVISAASLVSLGTLGALAARVGGASPWTGAARVTFWGAVAMAVTSAVGHLFGAAG